MKFKDLNCDVLRAPCAFAVILMTLVLAAILLHGIPLTGAFAEDTVPCRSFEGLRPQRERSGPVLSKGKFLVAGKNMRDPRFAETVLLLIDYSPDGAMGLIVNRPTEVKLSSLFPKIPELREREDFVFFGGPVNIERILVLIRSEGKVEESLRVFGDIYVSSSEKILRQMAARAGRKFRVYVGYAGWSPQQLDPEVLRGDWQIIEADAKTIFDKKSSDIWPELIRRGSMLWVEGTRDISPAAANCTNIDMIRLQASRASRDAILFRY